MFAHQNQKRLSTHHQKKLLFGYGGHNYIDCHVLFCNAHPTFYRFYFDSYNPKRDRSICSLVGWAKQHWQIIRFKNHYSLPTALPNNNHQHLNNLHFGCWVLLRATQPTRL